MTQEVFEVQLEIDAEAARRIAQVKSDTVFMTGVYRAMKETAQPIRWEDLNRKYVPRT